jgi:protein-tyrosine-phosphatase
VRRGIEPAVPQEGRRGDQVYLGFPDPAETTGTDDEVMAAFRQVRDDIAQQASSLLNGPAFA